MKHGWALLVALTLFICGILSVSSRYQDAASVALQGPGPIVPAVKRDTSSTALAMIGMPGMKLPERESPALKVLLTAEEKRLKSEKLADRRNIEAAALVLKNPDKDF